MLSSDPGLWLADGSEDSAEVCKAWPPRPHTARGGTWTSGTSARTPRARAAGGWPGHRSASIAPSSLKVLGFSSTSARPAAASLPVSTPVSCLPSTVFRWRSRTGFMSARNIRQSRAETRWIVPRISAMPTSRRKRCAAQQQLPVEQGTVERSPAQRLSWHRYPQLASLPLGALDPRHQATVSGERDVPTRANLPRAWFSARRRHGRRARRVRAFAAKWLLPPPSPGPTSLPRRISSQVRLRAWSYRSEGPRPAVRLESRLYWRRLHPGERSQALLTALRNASRKRFVRSQRRRTQRRPAALGFLAWC